MATRQESPTHPINVFLKYAFSHEKSEISSEWARAAGDHVPQIQDLKSQTHP